MTVSATGDTIRLKNGQTIVADNVEEVSGRVEYTIGESTYKIPSRLVEEIIRGAAPPGTASTGSSNKATGIKTEFHGQIVYLYESTEELREECATGEYENRIHAEFEPLTSPEPNSLGKSGREACDLWNLDLGQKYESLMDRGVELERALCTYGPAYISSDPPRDPRILPNWREYQKVGKELEESRSELIVPYRVVENARDQLEKSKREDLDREVPGRESLRQLSESQIAAVDAINRKYASQEEVIKRDYSREALRMLRVHLDFTRLQGACKNGAS